MQGQDWTQQVKAKTKMEGWKAKDLDFEAKATNFGLKA